MTADLCSRQLSSILKSIVGQLARQNEECMTLAEEHMEALSVSVSRPGTQSLGDLERLMKQMFRCFRDVAILIDGVDECHDPGEVSEALSMMKVDGTSVHTLIFSRKELSIEPFLEDFRHIEIAAESQDLRLYVPVQIEERCRRRKLRIRDAGVKDLIIDKLVNGADGM